jgi:hypothetical protein
MASSIPFFVHRTLHTVHMLLKKNVSPGRVTVRGNLKHQIRDLTAPPSNFIILIFIIVIIVSVILQHNIGFFYFSNVVFKVVEAGSAYLGLIRKSWMDPFTTTIAQVAHPTPIMADGSLQSPPQPRSDVADVGVAAVVAEETVHCAGSDWSWSPNGHHHHSTDGPSYFHNGLLHHHHPARSDVDDVEVR